jgi:hypothetical protein
MSSEEKNSYGYAPPYASLIGVMQGSFRQFLLVLGISLSPIFIAYLLSFVNFVNFDVFLACWIRLNFSAWIFGAFYFMNYIFKKSLNYYDEFLFLTQKQKSDQRIVKDSYDFMFNSNKQYICYVIIGVLCTLTGYTLQIQVSGFTKWYIIFWSFWSGFAIGSGLWYAFGLARFIFKITSIQGLHINPIYPSTSVGLSEIIQLSSFWSFCFICECLLVYTGLFITHWMAPYSLVRGLQVFWLMIILLIAIFNFVFPYSRIKKLISLVKREHLKSIQNLLDVSWANATSTSNVEKRLFKEEIYYMAELQRLIRKDNEAMFDTSVILRLLSSVVVPLILTMYEKPDIINKIINNFFKGH